MQENPEEVVDTSAHLPEADLPKPGTTVTPGAEPIVPTPAPEDGKTHDELSELHTLEQTTITEEEPAKASGFGHSVWEVVKVLLFAGVVWVILNVFLFQAYYVSGNSMNPDFHDTDYLLVNKLPTTWHNIENFFGAHANLNIQRGDIIVFKPPEAPNLFYIKRVIGLPGDRVVLKDGVFTIYNQQNPDGLVLKEPYTDSGYKTEGSVDATVEQGHVFVVGDNRSPGGSYDSRAWGQLSEDSVSGIVFFRVKPLNDLGFIEGAKYDQ